MTSYCCGPLVVQACLFLRAGEFIVDSREQFDSSSHLTQADISID